MKLLSTRPGRKVATTVTGLLVAGFVTLGVAPPANAIASNCLTTRNSISASTTCLGGPGYYRVAVNCVNWAKAYSTVVYGPWIHTSWARPSTAWCGWNWGWPMSTTTAWAQTK